MAEFRPTTHHTVCADLRAYADYLEKHGDEGERGYAAERLNLHLDAMLSGDCFGTEGQLDPRGDHRG